MKLCTFYGPGSVLKPGAIVGREVVDLSVLVGSLPPPSGRNGQRLDHPHWMLPFLTRDGRAAVAATVSSPSTRYPRIDSADVRFGPPVPRPGKIIAIGRNYRAHIEESVSLGRMEPIGSPSSSRADPTGFFKVTSALAGPFDAVEIPPSVQHLDYEVQLAVVIGAYARDVPLDAALDHVAGYFVINNINAREIVFAELDQLGIVVGMNFEGFAPGGPYMVTADEVGSPEGLRLRCWVDGELRQDSSTSEMVYSVPELISHYSQIGLYAGDVIMTGTPAGIAASRKPDPEPYYLRAGSVVECEIADIGRIRNQICLPHSSNHAIVDRPLSG